MRMYGPDARLCIGAAITALALNRHADAARWITAAEQGEPAGPFYDGFSSVEGAAATARTAMSVSAGDLSRTLVQARRAVELEPASSPWRATAVLAHGIALRWLGRAREAEQSLHGAVRVTRVSGQMAISAVYALGHLAGIAADQLDWRRAAEHAEEALRVAEGSGPAEHLVCGMAHLVRGRVAEQAGEHADALPHVLRGLDLAARGAGPHDRAWGNLVLARVRHGLGDRDGAQAAFGTAREVLARCPEPGPVLTELLATTRRRIQDTARVPRQESGHR